MEFSMGDRIRKLRKDKQLTQTQLGDLVGVSKNAIYDWEKGTYQPEGQNLINLAKAFDVSTAFLLGKTNDPVRYPSTLLGEDEHATGNKPDDKILQDAIDAGIQAASKSYYESMSTTDESDNIGVRLSGALMLAVRYKDEMTDAEKRHLRSMLRSALDELATDQTHQDTPQ